MEFEFRGTINFTDEERARYKAEEARFKQAHPDCRMGVQKYGGAHRTLRRMLPAAPAFP